MSYNAVDVARHILSYCTKIGKSISNLRLQYMLYFAWIDFYKKTGRYLFNEDICAWKFGPAVPDVYYEFCAYGGIPIRLESFEWLPPNGSYIVQETVDRMLEENISATIGKANSNGGALDRVFNHGNGNRAVIPFCLITRLECGCCAQDEGDLWAT